LGDDGRRQKLCGKGQAMNLRLKKVSGLAAVVLLTATFSFASTPAPKKHRVPAGSKILKTSHHGSKKSRKSRPRGQQAIDGERARQIQQALVREHYMTGAPSGKWDDATQQALRRYQADQGWQSKSVPDSRALIRLGLGPDRVHLLNPESAMTTEPQFRNRTPGSPRSASPSQAAPASFITPGQSSATVATPIDVSPSR
jgi:hypothetical protein